MRPHNVFFGPFHAKNDPCHVPFFSPVLLRVSSPARSKPSDREHPDISVPLVFFFFQVFVSLGFDAGAFFSSFPRRPGQGRSLSFIISLQRGNPGSNHFTSVCSFMGPRSGTPCFREFTCTQGRALSMESRFFLAGPLVFSSLIPDGP